MQKDNSEYSSTCQYSSFAWLCKHKLLLFLKSVPTSLSSGPTQSIVALFRAWPGPPGHLIQGTMGGGLCFHRHGCAELRGRCLSRCHLGRSSQWRGCRLVRFLEDWVLWVWAGVEVSGIPSRALGPASPELPLLGALL